MQREKGLQPPHPGSLPVPKPILSLAAIMEFSMTHTLILKKRELQPIQVPT